MRHLLLKSIACCFIVSLCPLLLTAQVWEQAYSYAIEGSSSSLNHVAIDDFGTVYSTGESHGRITLDDGTYLSRVGTSENAFVLKHDATGTFQWGKIWDANSNAFVRSVATDGDGNVYITGKLVSNTGPGNQESYFIAKLDPAGNLLWKGKCPGEPFMAVTPDGTMYIAFVFDGLLPSYDFLDQDFSSFSANARFIYAAADSSGHVLWHKVELNIVAANNRKFVKGITVNAGKMAIYGSCAKLKFGPFNVQSTSGITADDYYAIVSAADGTPLYAENPLGYEVDINDVEISNNGDVYLLVEHEDTTRIAGMPIPAVPDSNTVVMKLKSNYTTDWVYDIGAGDSNNSPHTVFANSFAITYDNEVLVFGHYYGNVKFGPALFTSANTDCYVLKLSDAGQFKWVLPFGSPTNVDRSKFISAKGDYAYLSGAAGHGTVLGTDTMLIANSKTYFIAKLNHNGNVIKGRAYKDFDMNATFTSGDRPIFGTTISIEPKGMFGFTEPNGNYTFYTDTGSYTLRLSTAQPYYTRAPDSLTVSFSTYKNISTGNDLRLIPVPGAHDLEISIIATSGVNPGYTASQKLRVSNPGTFPATGKVKLLPSDSLLVANTTPAMTAIGDTLVLNFTAVRPDSTFYVDISYDVPVHLRTASQVKTRAWVTPVVGDTMPSNNSDALNQIVTDGFDPNDKLVNPAEDIYFSALPLHKQFVYTVRFQNTGNDTAINILITDTISEKFELASFELLTASHPVRLSADGRVIQFRFDNIQLPDSNSNEAASHGFVHYRINRIDSLVIGDHLYNTAAIYFDYNAPVITNTTDNEIIQDAAHVCDLVIEVTVVDDVTCAGNGRVAATVINGVPPYNFTWSNGATSDTLSNLPGGTYSVVVGDSFACFADSAVTVDVGPGIYLGLLSGDDTVKVAATTTYVIVSSTSTYNYHWTVTNGTLVSGQGTDTIQVKWTSLGTGTVEATATYQNCTDMATMSVFVHMIASVGNMHGLDEIAVFPNPATDIITINGVDLLPDVTGSLRNMLGQVVYQQLAADLQKGVLEISVAALPKGVYYLSIGDAVQQRHVRIVKQ